MEEFCCVNKHNILYVMGPRWLFSPFHCYGLLKSHLQCALAILLSEVGAKLAAKKTKLQELIEIRNGVFQLCMHVFSSWWV